MGLFDKRQSISRRELGETLRKHPGRIPGTGGRKYSQRERTGLSRSAFGQKYGSQISKGDYRRAIKGLEASRRNIKDRKQQRRINEQIRYLRELGGKNT
jgi:hypothetical protein